MIQWGYVSSSGFNRTVYLNTSYFDSNYTVLLTPIVPGESLTVAMFVRKTTSYFVCRSRYIGIGSNGDIVTCSDPFMWFSIGRWK